MARKDVTISGDARLIIANHGKEQQAPLDSPSLFLTHFERY